MAKEYRWRLGFHAPKGIDAAKAKIEMERVRKSHGMLTADALVEASRPKTATLHGAFEWDNKRAGEQWRKQHAMQMIRSIEVVHETQSQLPHREYVLASVSDDATAYVPMTVAARSVGMCEDVMSRLQRELDGSIRSLDEFERVAAAVGRDTSAVKTARKHIRDASEVLRESFKEA